MTISLGYAIRSAGRCVVSVAALVLAVAPAGAQDSDGDGTADSCETAYGNFDLDGAVSGADLSALLSQWGQSGAAPADLDGDGLVAGGDVAALLGRWGAVNYAASGEALCWAKVLTWAPDPAIVIDASLRNAIIATGLPWRVLDTGTQIEMLLVPPGTFNMGCSESVIYGCTTDEYPVHEVTLTAARYMGRYEVTQAQWQARVGFNPSYFQGASYPDAPSRPVEQVSEPMIMSFLIAVGMRFPTEAEWEFAYRAGTTTAYHSGPGFPNGTNDDSLVGQIAWYGSNSGSQTHVVGAKAANALGLHDMSGNVIEYVSDYYMDWYYSESPATDPTGPLQGLGRVVRGGFWSNVHYNGWLRASHRAWSVSLPSWTLGFRVARNP